MPRGTAQLSRVRMFARNPALEPEGIMRLQECDIYARISHACGSRSSVSAYLYVSFI
jgi:hypothetical protein